MMLKYENWYVPRAWTFAASRAAAFRAARGQEKVNASRSLKLSTLGAESGGVATIGGASGAVCAQLMPLQSVSKNIVETVMPLMPSSPYSPYSTTVLLKVATNTFPFATTGVANLAKLPRLLAGFVSL